MFQRYKRCSWEIEDKPEDDEDGELGTAMAFGYWKWDICQILHRENDFSTGQDHVNGILGTVYHRISLQFETISHFLSPRGTPNSMVLNRTDEEELLTLPNATTRCK